MRSPPTRSAPLSVPVLAALLTVILLGPWIAPHRPTAVVSRPFAPPVEAGPFGTDRLGRDVASRLLHSGRPVVVVPLAATAAATAVGGPLGLLLAASGSRRGRAARRALDAVVVVPPLLALLLVLHRLGDSRPVLALAAGAVGVPYVARFVRANAEPVLGRAHVEAARLRGESTPWVLRHEVLPNLVGPLVADAGLRFAGTVSLVTGVVVLGFGPEPPATDWAAMVADNLPGIGLNPWATVVPAAGVAALATSANLVADRFAGRWAR